MIERQLTTAIKEFIESADMRQCPNCKKTMTQVDSVRENGFSYIWYECGDANCYGQWLEKRTIRQGA